jgi:hypothetical protein
MRQVGPKVVEIAVEHYSNIILTSNLGIVKYTVRAKS